MEVINKAACRQQKRIGIVGLLRRGLVLGRFEYCPASGVPGAVLLGRDGAPGDEIVAVAFTFRVVGWKVQGLVGSRLAIGVIGIARPANPRAGDELGVAEASVIAGPAPRAFLSCLKCFFRGCPFDQRRAVFVPKTHAPGEVEKNVEIGTRLARWLDRLVADMHCAVGTRVRGVDGVGEPRRRSPRRGPLRVLDARRGVWPVPELRELRNRPGGYLSGGEQQMLTVARTLMGNPELLLLDEPSEGLAPLVVESLLDNVRALKAGGVTILLAEQGVDFSLALADRVYILEKGSIRHTGPAAELRDDTALRDRLLAL